MIRVSRDQNDDYIQRVNRLVTTEQAAFLDMIERLRFCEFHSLVVMNGNPVRWQKLVEQGRFDLTKGKKNTTVE